MMHRFSKVLLPLLLSCSLPLAGVSATIRAPHFRHGVMAEPGKATGLQFACLPDGFDLNEIIAYRSLRNGKEVAIKLKDKLVEMQASCKRGKLLDKKKREIKLFRPACFGNPPADYDEIQQKEKEELSRLQKHYTVIIIECNPRIQ